MPMCISDHGSHKAFFFFFLIPVYYQLSKGQLSRELLHSLSLAFHRAILWQVLHVENFIPEVETSKYKF